MTMNRKTTIREIGRRTRLKNRDVQLMLETLIEVWTEELMRGGRIELENFIVLEAQRRILTSDEFPRYVRRITLRLSKNLRALLALGHIE